MWIAEALTQWRQTADGNTVALVDLLAPGDSCEDITGQPTTSIIPDPNSVVWRVRCQAATLDAIDADANHTVLTAEEERDA